MLSRRRRWLTGRRICFALEFGVLITIAISWTAMFVPWGRHGYGPPIYGDLGLVDGSNYRTYQVSEGSNAWHHVVSYWWMQVSGQSLMMTIDDCEAGALDLNTLPSHLRPSSIDDIRVLAWYREVGWPMKAMTCSVHWQTQIANADIIYRVEGGVQLPRDAEFNPRALPLTPLWMGFIVNTILFAVLWLFVVWVAGAARARSRKRRNCCSQCGYPRTGLPAGSACPECGLVPI
jgi:hypothetical protein